MKKYIVKLKKKEKETLRKIIKSKKSSPRNRKNAQILLKSDESKKGAGWPDAKIAESFDAGIRTIERVRQRFVEYGLEVALNGKESTRVYRRRLDGDAEAQLTVLACSEAPEGQARWTLKLLGERLVELEVVDSIARETIRQTLKKTNLSLG